MSGAVLIGLGAGGSGGGGVFDATISPTSISTTGSTSNPATVTATGGVPPYTYQWLFSDTPIGMQIDTPNAQSTTFTATETGTVFGNSFCRVTDSASNTVDAPGIPIILQVGA